MLKVKEQEEKQLHEIKEELLFLRYQLYLHCTKSFPLRISSVNVTKSAVSCGFGHIY